MLANYCIFIPAYNVEPFIERCLESVATQQFDQKRVRVVMIDDASTDLTIDILSGYQLQFEQLGLRSELHFNDYNERMPKNLALYLREGDPEEVIFLLDADDWLPNPMALYNLDMHYYDNDELWLTYGSYLKNPDPYSTNPQALPYDEHVIEGNLFRMSQPRYNHPITFRRKLFNAVEDWELQHDNGSWFGAAYDHAIMIPMLELASRGHFKWVPDFLYVYNDENPLSEVHVTTEGDLVHATVGERIPRAPIQ